MTPGPMGFVIVSLMTFTYVIIACGRSTSSMSLKVPISVVGAH